MPTVGQLTTEIAATFGEPRAHVAWIVRKLREAGLLTTGPRGRGAPDMSALDVARLVIGILASNKSPDASVEAVNFFGKLPYDRLASNSDKVEGFFSGFHHLSSMGEGVVFEDALASIFINIPNIDRPLEMVCFEVDINNLRCRIEIDGRQYIFFRYPYERSDFDRWGWGVGTKRYADAAEIIRLAYFTAGKDLPDPFPIADPEDRGWRFLDGSAGEPTPESAE